VGADGAMVGCLPRRAMPGAAEVTLESKEIHELIEILSRSSLTTLEIEREGFRLRLEKSPPEGHVPTYVVRTAEAMPPTVTAIPPAMVAPVPVPATAASAEDAALAVDDGLIELRSPFVGTFYRAPSPDSPPFVEIGGKVRKGQVVCIVEAMKLMNEIEAEIEGEVVDILAKNGQPVEYGEILFRLRPL